MSLRAPSDSLATRCIKALRRCLLLAMTLSAALPVAAVDITTYHNDNFRTGWNWQETTLTPAVIRSGAFAHLSKTILPAAHAQPLVLSHQAIDGVSYATIVYVLTRNNSVFAIDGATGNIIKSVNLGPRAVYYTVPSTGQLAPLGFPLCTAAQLTATPAPDDCYQVNAEGVLSTPVIDKADGVLYLVIYGCHAGVPLVTVAETATTPGYEECDTPGDSDFILYAIDTATLAPRSSMYLSAMLKAQGVTTILGNIGNIPGRPSAGWGNRQRAALTLFHSGVLIPFTSVSDEAYLPGFILYAGPWRTWNTATDPTVDTSAFVTSVGIDAAGDYSGLATIWMSGSGPAVYGNSIYFATGNGKQVDAAGHPVPVDPTTNPHYLPESVVRLEGDVTWSWGLPTLSYTASFAPSCPPNSAPAGQCLMNGVTVHSQTWLDAYDGDLGSGGVMIVPAGNPVSIEDGLTSPLFITAAGKDLVMYVTTPELGARAVQAVALNGACYCRESYFTGSDGVGRVLASGGLQTQELAVSAAGLTPIATTGAVTPSSTRYVWNTSVSSDGIAPGTAVLWVVSFDSTGLTLRAYDAMAPDSGALYVSPAITTTNSGYLSAMPVVANGHVYVASNGGLDIYGVAGE